MHGCETLSKVLVLKRTGHDVGFDPARDVWWHELVGQQSERCEPEWVEAEHPLYLLYTSGSTGKPKGIQHSSTGYLLGAPTRCQWVLALHDDRVFWCTANEIGRAPCRERVRQVVSIYVVRG